MDVYEKKDTLLIPADKTTNFYAINPTSYSKLINENVTKGYKKTNDIMKAFDAQLARLAKRCKLDDHIEKLAEKKAFITLKDGKPKFQDRPTCRLINPSKSEIGIISKQILDEIKTPLSSTARESTSGRTHPVY